MGKYFQVSRVRCISAKTKINKKIQIERLSLSCSTEHISVLCEVGFE